MTEQPDDQGDDQLDAAVTAAHLRARLYLTAIHQPGDHPATNLTTLLCEARDSIDYGDTVYAEALVALAMRLATDLRAQAIAAAQQ